MPHKSFAITYLSWVLESSLFKRRRDLFSPILTICILNKAADQLAKHSVCAIDPPDAGRVPFFFIVFSC
jgi:hypothetical protein